MTPTNALIEKMARAMVDCDEAQTSPKVGDGWDGAFTQRKKHWRRLARAAYEAEHEEDGK